MKRITLVVLGAISFLSGFTQAPPLKLFPLSQVSLLNGPMKDAQLTDLKYMLALDPDRLLAPFLREAGIPTTAVNYSNWENTGLDGHIGGHYLSALSYMVAATKDPEAGRRLNYMLDQLALCQVKNGNGYVGSIPDGKKMWEEIAAGKIKADGFSLNKKWVPLYNIHKTFAGLIDAYRVAGFEKAKPMLLGLSNWFLQLSNQLSDAQLQTMMKSEHGGLNEVFADVFAITGDQKFLQLAQRWSHLKILNPLLHAKDSLNGLHANTQIPKVIGFDKIAGYSNDTAWGNAANFFWKNVVEKRTVSIGGNSVREHFHPSSDFSSMMESKEGPETCNSYNMLKLTTLLFLQHPQRSYMDYYERTLYNHILSSQHPNGGFVYFTPMRPRHYRVYSQPDQSFWCCVGSGMENHGKYGELIYAYTSTDLYVNLFIPSTLQWKEKGLSLTQTTRFPLEENTKMKLQLKTPQLLNVYFRNPSWVTSGRMKVYLNGKLVTCQQHPQGYLSLKRIWRDGDVISLSLPMKTYTESLPDGSSWVSFVKGPIVLASITDTTDLMGLSADSSRMGHIAQGPLYANEAKATLPTNFKDHATFLQPIKGKPFHYRLLNGEELQPFYQIHDARYRIYWPYISSEKVSKDVLALKEKEAALLALDAQTVDVVTPGEQQPESDHHLQGEQTETGIHMDRHWRHAAAWFSYDLKNKSGQGKKLQLTLFGGDSNRNFDVYINQILVATMKLTGERGGVFYEQIIPLPDALTSSPSLTVKFVAHAGSLAGGIYGVRLLK